MAINDVLEALEIARTQYEDLQQKYESLTSEHKHSLAQIERYKISTSNLESRLDSANRKLKNAQRIQNEFLDTISHELLTPLNGILGMARLLNDIPLPKEAKESVDIIHSCGESLEKILKSLLDLLHFSKGEIDLVNSTFDPIHTIESIINEYAHTIYQKGLEISYNPQHRQYESIELDKDRLRQLVHILLSNAVKFTQSGHIIVESQIVPRSGGDSSLSSQHEFHLKVIDTGIGIAPEHTKDIFRPFEQLDSSNNRNYGGLGIGLTLGKEIISRMDGAILIDSQPDKGSTFFVTLPLPGASLSVRKKVDPLPFSRNITISTLHPPHKTLLTEMFMSLGISVSFAHTNEVPNQRYSKAVWLIDYPSDNKKSQEHDALIARSGHLYAHIIAFVPPGKNIPPQIKTLFDVIIPKPITLTSIRGGLEYTTSIINGHSTEQLTERTVSDIIPEKVLLVENNVLNQKIVLHLLGMLGLTVEYVNNLDEMKSKIASSSYSHVVINPSVDPTSNLSLTYLILNATKLFNKARIVAIKGKNFNISEEQLANAGFHTCVTLPTPLDDFAEALQVKQK